MLKQITITLLFSFLLVAAFGQATGKIRGVVTDKNFNNEPVGFVIITLMSGGIEKQNTTSDGMDGTYSFSGLEPGIYEVIFSSMAYNTLKVEGIRVSSNRTSTVNAEMVEPEEGIAIDKEGATVIGYRIPLTSGQSEGGVTGEEIARLPERNLSKVAQIQPGVTTNSSGELSVKGTRSNAIQYYLDGILIRGTLPQSSNIEEYKIITGGLPSKYGDVLGGIIEVTSKGPSKEFSIFGEMETSSLFDNLHYNIGSVSLSGPIIKDKETNAVKMGYRVSGNYQYQADNYMPAKGEGHWTVTEDALARLKENPVTRLTDGSIVSTANLLTRDDFVQQNYRNNNDNTRLDLLAKIDYQVSKDVSLYFGGSGNLFRSKNLPNTNVLMNYDENGINSSYQWRTFARMTHRINTTKLDSLGNDRSKIKGLYYSLQADYERNYSFNQNAIHKDNLFNYGYVGRYDVEYFPTGRTISPTLGEYYVDYGQRTLGFTPSDINPVLSRYNEFSPNIMRNGIFNNTYTAIQAYYQNVGIGSNLYSRGETNQLRFTAEVNMDYVAKSLSKSGEHALRFGFSYEQRTDRSWALAPRSLWQIAGQLVNSHFSGVDTNNYIGFDPSTYIDIYAPRILGDAQEYFDKKVREKFGYSDIDFINVNGLDPSQLSLDMFTPDNLLEQRIISDYYGYDYLGNKLNNTVSFNDFWSDIRENGDLRYRPVAPNNPTYMATYIQDEYTLDDLTIRFGLRLDRFDANTKVLKDPFALYDLSTVDEYNASSDNPIESLPDNIGGDFIPYFNGTNVIGYRNGEDWYNASGTQVNDPTLIFGSTAPAPDYDEARDIKSDEFDPNSIFEDYKPWVGVSPRLYLSFPINDNSNFFAHFDMLSQRPTNNVVTPIQYYYMIERASNTEFFNNANLKPRLSTDYQLGFSQKINPYSAMTIMAYYKEFRNEIQLIRYRYAVPRDYTTYGNQDWGNVKGVSLSYQSRAKETSNSSMQLNYTLQFADGTGSNPTSQASLIQNGNLRTIYPLDTDIRHTIGFMYLFRFKQGEGYNGPVTKNGAKLLESTGFSLLGTATSGRPYTASRFPEPFGGNGTQGGIFGSRLPWALNLDARIDRDLYFRKEVKDLDGFVTTKPVFANVYLRATNVLNLKNIRNVYSASGSPDDDGYLNSALGQSTLEGFTDVERERYLMYYGYRLDTPFNYTQGRRLYVGFMFNFN